MATVHVEDTLHLTLQSLAEDEGRPIARVLEDAVDQYRRARFLDEMREGYARLKQDPVSWQEYLAEAREWDQISADGLEPSASDEFVDAFDDVPPRP